MSVSIPLARNTFAPTERHLGSVVDVRVLDLARPPAFLTIKVKVAVQAIRAADGWVPDGREAVDYLDFDNSLRPVNALARQLAADGALVLHEPEDVCRVEGRHGEFGFGDPHPVTRYQPIHSWVNVSDSTLSILQPLPFPLENPPFLFRRLGELFHVRFRGEGHTEEGTFPAWIGLVAYARLLQNPGRAVKALQLLKEVSGPEACLPGSRQEATDLEGLQKVYEQICELREDLDAAREANDSGAGARLEAELEALQNSLQRDRGFRGRVRQLQAGCPDERARKQVWAALERARGSLARTMPRLARHLKESCHSSNGTFTYLPAATAPGWLT
jgi:hypothetical protein